MTEMGMMKENHFIFPDWDVPANVRAVSTTRLGGFSSGVYSNNNLAFHVADDPACVEKNRAHLKTTLALPAEPRWLTQVHSNRVVDVSRDALDEADEADASYGHGSSSPCLVMTADCLPLLLCDKKGQQVAAVHAGWRGLLNDIIENSLGMFDGENRDVIAWMGPAISQKAFEVGAEVYEAFVQKHDESRACFQPIGAGKYMMDIYALAKQRLNSAGVNAIYGGQYCTFSDATRFFSFRRDGECGRMATLIWLDND